jgi:glycosyltransferase involved in cell wall biosynthesis
MYRKFRKLYRDPLAFFLDSDQSALKALGLQMFRRQTRRFLSAGKAASDQKISVVMTAYNTSHLVEAAVRSVLAQTHQNFELMVIDDASTDDTLDILKKLKASDARMRVFHSPTNHGTYWSKNWCVNAATGNFIATLDSDDTSNPERLQMQLGALMSNPKTVATTARWRRINDAGQELEIDGRRERMAAISLMFRRTDVRKKMGFYDSVRISADTEFITRMETIFGKKNVRHLRHHLYTGLLRDGSLTTGENSGFSWQADGTVFRRELSGDRAEYHRAFSEWHADAIANETSLMIEFPLGARTIPAGASMLRGCDDAALEQVVEV